MIKIKKVRPTLNHILTTADTYDTVQLKDGMIDTSKEEGQVKEYQKVIAIGPNVRDIKVGETVLINPQRYMVPTHSLNEGSVFEKDKDEVNYTIRLPMYTLECGNCLYIFDTDVDMVLEDYE